MIFAMGCGSSQRLKDNIERNTAPIASIDYEAIDMQRDVALSTGEQADNFDAPVFFIIGGPGSGKGTQCAKVAQRYALAHLSVGNLLRQQVEQGTKLGKRVARIMETGELVPMKTVMWLLVDAMVKERGKVDGYLIDGFPRDLEQAEAFERQVAHCRKAICLQVPDGVLRRRLLHRATTSGRADDNAATIEARLRTFHEKTEPIVQYYNERGKCATVDGDGSVDRVYGRIKRLMDKEMKMGSSK